MSAGNSRGCFVWVRVCVYVHVWSLLACLARCQQLAYSAPNSCKVPSSPPWTNSCRSCPLRCAQSSLHVCKRVGVSSYICVYVYVFERELGGEREQNFTADWIHDANNIHAFCYALKHRHGCCIITFTVQFYKYCIDWVAFCTVANPLVSHKEWVHHESNLWVRVLLSSRTWGLSTVLWCHHKYLTVHQFSLSLCVAVCVSVCASLTCATVDYLSLTRQGFQLLFGPD